MEDTGWYKPDYSMTTTLKKGIHWGFHAGCDFATKKCDEDLHPQYYCSAEDPPKCSSELRKIMSCVNCGIDATGTNNKFIYNEDNKMCASGSRREHCPIYVPVRDMDCRLFKPDSKNQYYNQMGGA